MFLGMMVLFIKSFVISKRKFLELGVNAINDSTKLCNESFCFFPFSYFSLEIMSGPLPICLPHNQLPPLHSLVLSHHDVQASGKRGINYKFYEFLGGLKKIIFSFEIKLILRVCVF